MNKGGGIWGGESQKWLEARGAGARLTSVAHWGGGSKQGGLSGVDEQVWVGFGLTEARIDKETLPCFLPSIPEEIFGMFLQRLEGKIKLTDGPCGFVFVCLRDVDEGGRETIKKGKQLSRARPQRMQHLQSCVSLSMLLR